MKTENAIREGCIGIWKDIRHSTVTWDEFRSELEKRFSARPVPLEIKNWNIVKEHYFDDGEYWTVDQVENFIVMNACKFFN